MPVGRFVLDVHGESRATWPASDAICAALQINNHLQDCANDYRDLDRVYVPHGRTCRNMASASRRWARRRRRRNCAAALRDLARRTKALLQEGEALPAHGEGFPV